MAISTLTCQAPRQFFMVCSQIIVLRGLTKRFGNENSFDIRLGARIMAVLDANAINVGSKRPRLEPQI